MKWTEGSHSGFVRSAAGQCAIFLLFLLGEFLVSVWAEYGHVPPTVILASWIVGAIAVAQLTLLSIYALLGAADLLYQRWKVMSDMATPESTATKCTEKSRSEHNGLDKLSRPS